jgi:hypothetical protein
MVVPEIGEEVRDARVDDITEGELIAKGPGEQDLDVLEPADEVLQRRRAVMRSF